MRRTCMSLSAVLTILVAAVGVATAADSPFTGTWKLLLPTKQYEVSLFLLKIDRAGKKVEVVSAHPKFRDYKASEIEGGTKSLSFLLSTPQDQAFAFVMQPPRKDAKGTLRGVARIGANIIGCWMEKTEQTEIDPRKAQQLIGGFADLEKALKKEDDKAKIKELHQVGKSHAGRPVGLLAYQILGGLLNKTRADAEAYREYVENYVKGAEEFGPLMVVGTNMQLSNMMRGEPRLIALTLACAKAAVKAGADDQPFNTRLSAELTLATAYMEARKPDEAARLAPTAEKLAEQIIKRQKEEARPFATAAMAGSLLNSPSDEIAEKGLGFARKAVKLLKDTAPLPEKISLERLLLNALKRTKKDDEAAAQATVVAKLEDRLDAEWEAKNIPFKTAKFARKGKSKRAVLVELFTGATCPPCVSADIAFDATGKTYASQDVVLLQYHLHIPRPDPLTNAASEARQGYYGDKIEGTPTVFVDGQATEPLGGGRSHAEARFKTLGEAVQKALQTEAGAKIELTVTREGNKVSLTATAGIDSLTGKPRLRFALVEETVRFAGSNGQRLHHHVVRAMPGGVEGFALSKKESTQRVSADVEEVRKSLNAALDTFSKKNGFKWSDRPMNLSKLKVIAFIQDDESKKVLQAVQADVPGAEKK